MNKPNFISIIGFGEEIKYKLNTLKIIIIILHKDNQISRMKKKWLIYIGKCKRLIINPDTGCR